MKNKILILFQIAVFSILLSCKKDTGSTPLVPLITTPTTGIELLKNGNFEEVAKNWHFVYEPRDTFNRNKYIMEVSEDFASSPKKSLKISCDKVNETSVYCQSNQSVSTAGLKVGSTITLSAKIKGVSLAGPGISIAIRGDKPTQTNIFFKTSQGTTPITGTFDFKEFSVTLPSYPGDAESLVIFLVFLPNTTGTVYMDDVSLKAF
jgi:hypothetical protein